jgi:hypothetical protein
MNFNYRDYGRSAAHFRQARRFAMASAQAAGALWEFRWSSTSALCFVHRVTLNAIQIANATAEELRFNLKVARTFTASDDTNTASILRATDLQKMNGDSDDSLLAAFRESNSATAATGGTKTLDTDSIAQGSFATIATLSTTARDPQQLVFDFKPLESGEHPLRLEANEGWVISLEVTKGATTGVVLNMETAWTEVTQSVDV